MIARAGWGSIMPKSDMVAAYKTLPVTKYLIVVSFIIPTTCLTIALSFAKLIFPKLKLTEKQTLQNIPLSLPGRNLPMKKKKTL